MTTATTTRFTTVSRSARAGFAGLAASVTLVLLSGVTHIACAQVKEVALAQARENSQLLAIATQAEESPQQIVVVTGKRA